MKVQKGRDKMFNIDQRNLFPSLEQKWINPMNLEKIPQVLYDQKPSDDVHIMHIDPKKDEYVVSRVDKSMLKQFDEIVRFKDLDSAVKALKEYYKNVSVYSIEILLNSYINGVSSLVGTIYMMMANVKPFDPSMFGLFDFLGINDNKLLKEISAEDAQMLNEAKPGTAMFIFNKVYNVFVKYDFFKGIDKSLNGKKIIENAIKDISIILSLWREDKNG